MDLSKARASIDIEIFAFHEKISTLIIERGSLTWKGKKWKMAGDSPGLS